MGALEFIGNTFRPLSPVRTIDDEHIARRRKLRSYGLNKSGEAVAEASLSWIEVYSPSELRPDRWAEGDKAYAFLGFPPPNVASRPARILWWVVSHLLTLPQNLAKFFFEYIPKLIQRAAIRLNDFLRVKIHALSVARDADDDEGDAPSRLWYVLPVIGIVIASIVYYAAGLLSYLGRAALSPWNHVRAGWEAGYSVEGGPYRTSTWKNWLFAGLNLLVSLAVIAFTFKYLIASAVTWVAEQVHASIAASVKVVGATLSVAEFSAGAAVLGRAPGIVEDVTSDCRCSLGQRSDDPVSPYDDEESDVRAAEGASGLQAKGQRLAIAAVTEDSRSESGAARSFLAGPAADDAPLPVLA